MKKLLLICWCAALSAMVCAQKTNSVEELFVSNYSGLQDLVPTNTVNAEARAIGNASLSRLWTGDYTLGYIEPNYQRMLVSLHTARKLAPERYSIEGASTVKDNLCTFKGTLTIKHIFPYINEEAKFGEKCYIMLAKYELAEDKSLQGSGKFEGWVTTAFYTMDGNVYLGDLMDGADGSCNNQFEGTWTSYKTKQSKKANWGISRIPDCGDLDQGDGEFVPNTKYHPYGWATYSQEIEEDDEIPSYLEGEGTLSDGLRWRKLVFKDGTSEVSLFKNDQLIRIFRPVMHDEMVPNDNSTVGEVTFEDINFDGYKDIVISLGAFGTTYNEYYDGYIYNPTTDKYEITSYQNICNPVIDATHKTITSSYHISNAKVGHEEWQFKAGDFVMKKKNVEKFKD